jgi:hypothetical protein
LKKNKIKQGCVFFKKIGWGKKSQIKKSQKPQNQPSFYFKTGLGDSGPTFGSQGLCSSVGRALAF